MTKNGSKFSANKLPKETVCYSQEIVSEDLLTKASLLWKVYIFLKGLIKVLVCAWVKSSDKMWESVVC